MAKLSWSEEGNQIALDVFEEHYGHMFSDTRIDVWFTEKVQKVKGGAAVATIKVVKKDSDVAAYAFRGDDDQPKDFLLIKLSKPIWDRLTPQQKRYYIDHELSHAWRDENNNLKVLGIHDIEENLVVMKRWPLNIREETYRAVQIIEAKLKREGSPDPPQNSFDFDAVALQVNKPEGDRDDVDDDAFH